MAGTLMLLFVALNLATSTILADGCKCESVFITVSSLWHLSTQGRGVTDRELELNWDPSCDRELLPDWVTLYDMDPHSNSQIMPSPLIKIKPIDYPEGFYRTNISLGRPKFPGGWDKGDEGTPMEGEHCFPFWAASICNDTLVSINCLKIRPTWMGDHKHQLGPLQLSSLFWPGTHNSGSHYRGTTLTRRDTFARYLLTQDTDVWGQLIHGIRYLDLRVGYYPSGNKSHNQDHRFWINHDLIRVGPLVPVLRDIKRFLTLTKREVVILDLHRFPVGFHGRQGRHRRLVTLLNKELGPFTLPPPSVGAAMTLNQIWTKDRRLIVAYGDKQVAKESKWLWSPLTQQWGNQQTPSGLQNFLQRTMDNLRQKVGSSALWAAMAELTPTPLDVMFKPTGSLRQMADSVNRNVTTWFRNLWWHQANIVATDFFLGNNIINVAIHGNLKKLNTVEP